MPIDAALLERIKANDPALIELNLGYEHLKESDIQPLVEALTQNTTLTTLYLGGNRIGDTGANVIALALKDNTTLTTLYLGSNQIGATGANAIALALKDNTTLPGHLPSLVNALAPAVKAAKDRPGDLLANATRQNVIDVVAKLKAATPILSAAATEGKIKIVGGIYRLDSGKVELIG